MHHLRKTAPLTSEIDAIQNFITEWCDKCQVSKLLLPGITLEDIKPLCPPTTMETCPRYTLIKKYHEYAVENLVGFEKEYHAEWRKDDERPE